MNAVFFDDMEKVRKDHLDSYGDLLPRGVNEERAASWDMKGTLMHIARGPTRKATVEWSVPGELILMAAWPGYVSVGEAKTRGLGMPKLKEEAMEMGLSWQGVGGDLCPREKGRSCPPGCAQVLGSAAGQGQWASWHGRGEDHPLDVHVVEALLRLPCGQGVLEERL